MSAGAAGWAADYNAALERWRQSSLWYQSRRRGLRGNRT